MYKVNKEINVTLSELMVDSESVSCKLSNIHKIVLEMGQDFCILRQRNSIMTSEEYEHYECKCWAILNILEEITK